MKVLLQSEALGRLEFELPDAGAGLPPIVRAVVLRQVQDGMGQSFRAAMASVLAGDEASTFTLQVIR